mmetsp:Transcript_37889/g.87988  ORF Transcript_37889/g.87988 Transcript_37889/m.87988 type:complete len:205 (+) Transcript_37889:122-736(+)
MSVLVPKTRLLLFRDGSSSGTSGWHQCKQGLPAPDTIDGVNGLQVSLPSLLQPLPPGPKVPEAPRLISGRIAGKLAHKTHKVQVEVDGEEEDVWIEGDKGPIWVMVHGQLWYGPRKDGYWGTHKSDHGWGRHWSVQHFTDYAVVAPPGPCSAVPKGKSSSCLPRSTSERCGCRCRRQAPRHRSQLQNCRSTSAATSRAEPLDRG